MFYADLCEFDTRVVAVVCEAWRREWKWPPSIAELREACEREQEITDVYAVMPDWTGVAAWLESNPGKDRRDFLLATDQAEAARTLPDADAVVTLPALPEGAVQVAKAATFGASAGEVEAPTTAELRHHLHDEAVDGCRFCNQERQEDAHGGDR